jgi:hypothetical protein
VNPSISFIIVPPHYFLSYIANAVAVFVPALAPVAVEFVVDAAVVEHGSAENVGYNAQLVFESALWMNMVHFVFAVKISFVALVPFVEMGQEAIEQ